MPIPIINYQMPSIIEALPAPSIEVITIITINIIRIIILHLIETIATIIIISIAVIIRIMIISISMVIKKISHTMDHRTYQQQHRHQQRQQPPHQHRLATSGVHSPNSKTKLPDIIQMVIIIIIEQMVDHRGIIIIIEMN